MLCRAEGAPKRTRLIYAVRVALPRTGETGHVTRRLRQDFGVQTVSAVVTSTREKTRSLAGREETVLYLQRPRPCHSLICGGGATILNRVGASNRIRRVCCSANSRA